MYGQSRPHMLSELRQHVHHEQLLLLNMADRTARDMQVPKMLAALRQTWAPRAFVVSFKLETDESIVLQKVRTPPASHESSASEEHAASPHIVAAGSANACFCGMDCGVDLHPAGRCKTSETYSNVCHTHAMVSSAHAWQCCACGMSIECCVMKRRSMMQAEGALEKYGVHVVVANVLTTRKDRVWLIRRGDGSTGGAQDADSSRKGDSALSKGGRSKTADGALLCAAGDSAEARVHNVGAPQSGKSLVQVIDRPAGEDCIEKQLVSRIARLHSSYLESVNQSLLRNLMASLTASRR